MRRDVADISLADAIFAPHYAAPLVRSVNSASTMLHTAPGEAAPAGSQLLHGEAFHVLDRSGGWAWGYCGHDHYVGYVRDEALGEFAVPTHVVCAREAIIFAQPDIKSRSLMTLSLGARLHGRLEGDFLVTSRGFVHKRHVAAIDERHGDFVQNAFRLIGAPYLWGGRGAGGVDCSGLVQLALDLAGLDCPRDSDQQGRSLGRALDPDESLERGDLVFFPGHVGFMTDGLNLLHANAWWMAVTVEPLAEVISRIAQTHEQPLLSRRRIES